MFTKIKKQFKSLLSTNNFYCPVCEKSHVEFQPLPGFYKEQANKYGYKYYGHAEMTSLETYSCLNCNASDRERLYAFWIDKKIKSHLFKHNDKLLHFAPEPALSNYIKSLKFFDYTTADLGMKGVDLKVDITDMNTISSNQYDFFICSHVLEHVNSDDQAISELFRITKKGGIGILMAPVICNLENTIEDPSVQTDDLRWKYFGQNDHVRLYAHNDYVEKIKKNGFLVDELDGNYFGMETFKMLGLKITSILYIVTKP